MIYLDHAATSYPKPPAVRAAVDRWFDEVGVSADRGDGPQTRAAAAQVQRARSLLGELCGARAERVAFVSGATEGLNLVLRSLLAPGARVLTTCFEHSSVVRVLNALRAERALQVDVVVDDDALCERLQQGGVDVCVFTHASNVTGHVFDAARICAAARAGAATTVLDVSQSAGYLPLQVGAHVLVGSAHKALHGPPGLGFVAAADDVALTPQKQGGTGSSVALDEHPTGWPHVLEAGTPNTPAIFGLAAALQWLAEQTPAELLARSLRSLDRMRAGLDELADVRCFAATSAQRTPVLSFVHGRYDVLELGAVLAGAGVHARSGFHCAPWVHAHLGTEAAGTVRVSPGPETSDDDVAAFLDVMRAL